MEQNQNHTRFNDEKMDEFFNSLPAYVQENVMQALPVPKSLDELKNVAQKFYF